MGEGGHREGGHRGREGTGKEEHGRGRGHARWVCTCGVDKQTGRFTSFPSQASSMNEEFLVLDTKKTVLNSCACVS